MRGRQYAETETNIIIRQKEGKAAKKKGVRRKGRKKQRRKERERKGGSQGGGIRETKMKINKEIRESRNGRGKGGKS